METDKQDRNMNKGAHGDRQAGHEDGKEEHKDGHENH
jgi:hypothetical protein